MEKDAGVLDLQVAVPVLNRWKIRLAGTESFSRLSLEHNFILPPHSPWRPC